jgi:hypothetical protein
VHLLLLAHVLPVLAAALVLTKLLQGGGIYGHR